MPPPSKELTSNVFALQAARQDGRKLEDQHVCRLLVTEHNSIEKLRVHSVLLIMHNTGADVGKSELVCLLHQFC